MATTTVTRLVSANTRDGVDTRSQEEKENSGKTAVGTGETTSVEAVHARGGQTAAGVEKVMFSYNDDRDCWIRSAGGKCAAWCRECDVKLKDCKC